MAAIMYVAAGIFLPLFPLSMIFNKLFAQVRNAVLRSILLLVWPQLGLSLVSAVTGPEPRWLLWLALFTSVLYAFRAISLREVGQWTGYLATSAWALLWVTGVNHVGAELIHLYALAFSLPLVLLTLIGAHLERNFGAAYVGLYGGLAQILPRLSGVLVFVVLAIIAAPLFPSFFAMLTTVTATTASAPLVALAVAGVWLLWSWAGVRLLQGLIVGQADTGAGTDISLVSAWAYAAVLIVLFIGGFYIVGDLL